jgi:hypothetical protein
VATLRLTREQRDQNKIPAVYARQILRAARDHQPSHQDQSDWQSLPSKLRNDFAAALGRLAAALDEPPTQRGP